MLQQRHRPGRHVEEHGAKPGPVPKAPDSTHGLQEPCCSGAPLLTRVRGDREGGRPRRGGGAGGEDRLLEAQPGWPQVPQHEAVEPDNPVHPDPRRRRHLAGVLDGHMDQRSRGSSAVDGGRRAEGQERRLAVQGSRPARQDRRPVQLRRRRRSGVVDVDAGMHARPDPPPEQALDVVVVQARRAHLPPRHDAVLDAQQRFETYRVHGHQRGCVLAAPEAGERGLGTAAPCGPRGAETGPGRLAGSMLGVWWGRSTRLGDGGGVSLPGRARRSALSGPAGGRGGLWWRRPPVATRGAPRA